MNGTTYSDSREVLAEVRDLLENAHYDHADDPTEEDGWNELDADDRARVEMLRDALEEMPESTVDSATGNSWGCAMVPETQFEDHARELAEDIGSIGVNTDWPLSYIDWTAAASALAQDYVSVDIDGTTYLCR